jgi:hypothetical protein
MREKDSLRLVTLVNLFYHRSPRQNSWQPWPASTESPGVRPVSVKKSYSSLLVAAKKIK